MGTLRKELTAMAARCREQLRLALDAFWTGSMDKLRDVEASDRALDRDEKTVDALLLRILALRQPVASDLRMLTASFRLVTDLERIGDEAVDLARAGASKALDGGPGRQTLERMTEAAETMMSNALNSFFQGKADVAAEVRRTEASIDALYDDVLNEASTFLSQHASDAASALTSVTVAKCIERVADHAANIAEGALFVLGADDAMAR
jgi:phosphate transport system protein